MLSISGECLLFKKKMAFVHLHNLFHIIELKHLVPNQFNLELYFLKVIH